MIAGEATRPMRNDEVVSKFGSPLAERGRSRSRPSNGPQEKSTSRRIGYKRDNPRRRVASASTAQHTSSPLPSMSAEHCTANVGRARKFGPPLLGWRRSQRKPVLSIALPSRLLRTWMCPLHIS